MPTPLIPLVGHDALRQRLRQTIDRDALPASLLLHGPRGVGKQRLALWLGQLLLCTGSGERPCGSCSDCRYAERLAHPDLRWFFPRPRRADGDASTQDVLDEYAEATAERVAAGGLYAAPTTADGIYVSSVRALVQVAAQTPALAQRKVFVVGDAERMVPQEGAEFAANAFLKLLEEPPADTVVIVTSSEPGALLPTIRSRLVAVRVPLLPEADVRRLLELPAFAAALDEAGVPGGTAERVRLAAGAPGTLLGADSRRDAIATAGALLRAAERTVDPPERIRAVMAVGAARSRGVFSDCLDALTVMLRDRVRAAVERGDERAAAGAARAVDIVQDARIRAAGNVSPQLLAYQVVAELGRSLL